MSSEQESRLARLLLREAFGEVVEKVCVYLLNTGTCTLAEIVQGTSIEQELVMIPEDIILHCACSQFSGEEVSLDSHSTSAGQAQSPEEVNSLHGMH